MELATRQALKPLVKATCYQKGETFARSAAPGTREEDAELWLELPNEMLQDGGGRRREVAKIMRF